MSFIRVVPPADADSSLSAAYGEVAGARGRVANILAVHSVHPEVMLRHLRLYQEIMFGESEITRLERETMAVAVSAANHCRY